MPLATPEDLASNRLLSILSEADRLRLSPHIHIFECEAGEVLQHQGESVVNTWFPCDSALASFCVIADTADSVEVAVVGSEGAIGGIVSNGNLPAYAQAHVRTGGRFLRIKTAALEHAKIDSVHLRHWFARYSDCLLAQVFQAAACNARHTIEQRACKWLLAASDRNRSDEITMTQEDLASLLGVGRSFVNRTLSNLRSKGMITTHRGRILLTNKPALKHASCGCLDAIENHFDEVLHGIYPKE